MKLRNIFMAIIGLLLFVIVYAALHLIDFALVYSIFLYFQFLVAPFLTAIGYLCHVIRLSIPYIFIYFLICLFFNITTYKTNSTIKFLKYTININKAKKSKIYIYLREYSYVLIIMFNFLLLFIIYYSYINNSYFYILIILLFYILIYIIIKIKHFLLRSVTWQSKKAQLVVNFMLCVLISAYISMSMEDLYISNFKLYGFENFWKLMDNKYYIKMPSKDINLNRLFNLSKQISSERYMAEFKKSVIKSNVIYNKLQAEFYNDQKFDNKNIAFYLHKMQKENEILSKFTNVFYKKFKYIFLMQTKIKPAKFIPISEIAERKKLFSWLRNSSNIKDMSKFYISEELIEAESKNYNFYLDSLNKNYNILITKKVYLISLNKNFNIFRSFGLFSEFNDSFKNNYAKFLNTEKNILVLKDFNNNHNLDYDYYHFKNEIFILIKETNFSLLSKKFKSLYTIKTFKFLFKKDILTDSELKKSSEPKAKKFIIPDLKKLQYWKTFKLNYKELIYNHSKEVKNFAFKKELSYNLAINDWLAANKFSITQEITSDFEDLYFVFDDEAYCLSDFKKLKQVENLVFNHDDQYDIYDDISDYINHYLENIKNRYKKIDLYIINNKNDLGNSINDLQNYRIHASKFSNIYYEIMIQNSNDIFKNIIEKSSLFQYFMITARVCLTYEAWLDCMLKIVNLNMDSFYLENLKDFSNFCKSDFTEGLQYNFSLAFNIIQCKYDFTHLHSIPDLEGLPGTFYEYIVQYKYNQEQLTWYVEHELLIDWAYELSYYALVNIMDSVNETDFTEDIFLFNLLNEERINPEYKWVDDLYATRLVGSERIKVDEIHKVFNELENYWEWVDECNDEHQLSILNSSYNIYELKLMKLFDFKGIKNLDQFNMKLGEDIKILKRLPELLKYKWSHMAEKLIEDFSNNKHEDFHDDIFDTWNEIRVVRLEQREYLFDLIRRSFAVSQYLNEYELMILDDFLEVKELKSEDFMWSELEHLMHFNYNILNEMEDLHNYLSRTYFDIDLNFKSILMKYNYLVQKAHMDVLYNMIEDIDLKQNALIENDEMRDYINQMKLKLANIKDREIYLVKLSKLPIYDWSTHSYITENIDKFMKECPDLLYEKMEALNKQLDEALIVYEDKKKNLKLYGEQKLEYSKQSNPLTKRFVEKNWGDYNYHSNKKDKVMSDWYKKKK
jgi:hypothetical protein